MNRAGHYQAGFIAGTGTAMALSMPPSQSIVCGFLATMTAGGKSSPDMDQTKLYRIMLPKFAEQHRGLTHWWGVPAMAWGIVAYLHWTYTIEWLWVIAAMILGWTSHLVVDFVFGAPGYGRGAGIPMTPLAHHRGLLGKTHGLKSDGKTAKVFETVIFPVVAAGLVALATIYQ